MNGDFQTISWGTFKGHQGGGVEWGKRKRGEISEQGSSVLLKGEIFI